MSMLQRGNVRNGNAPAYTPWRGQLYRTRVSRPASTCAAVASTEHNHVTSFLSCALFEFHKQQIGVQETPHPVTVMFLTSTKRE